MNIEHLLEFLVCPYCVGVSLVHEGTRLWCARCRLPFEIIEGVPVLIKKENLCRQEIRQLTWFDRHYGDFSKDTYRLEKWRLSMIKRIFDVSFKTQVRAYLDIGCGATGYTVIEAAKRNGWVACGADISVEAMVRARYLAEKEGVGEQTAFVVCSAQNLPFKKRFFDYISAVSVLEHIADDRKVIAAIGEILNRGGYAYICVPNTYLRMWLFLWPLYMYLDCMIGHKRHYSLEGLSKKMQQGGFMMEQFFYNGHLIKFRQIILEKLELIKDDAWWDMEKRDITSVSSGVQLNAIYRKT